MFEKLLVWKKSHDLVLEVYRLTKKLPTDERFGLISQMRRAAVSVPANLAEGSRRRTFADRRHYVVIAGGSLHELRYYFLLCKDLGFCTITEHGRLELAADEIGRMLYGLEQSLHA